MKNYIILFITVFLLSLTFQSCQKEFEDDLNSQQNSNAIKYENIPWDTKGKAMEKMAIGISNALQNVEFRTLVKEKALQKINGDYDVLYHLVKNIEVKPVYYKSINSRTEFDASTLHEFLIQFFENEQELIEYENKLPLLTIFVPSLPENSFSAETWDVNDENQIPDVAIRLDNISYVPVVSKEGEYYLIDPELEPGYPIVVLKDNERLVSNNDPIYSELDTRMIPTDTSISYKFLNEGFDPLYSTPSNNSNTPFTGVSPTNIPQYLKDAYNIWENYPGGGWQRDKIYYNLTPTNTTGIFNYGKYREYITTIKLSETPYDAYYRISDSFNETKRDPKLKNWQTSKSNAWTDGLFEIMVNMDAGSKSGNIVASKKPISVGPNELFEYNWLITRVEVFNLFGIPIYKKYYKPNLTAVKTLNTAIPTRRTELSTWDLDDFANRWFYSFEEIDVSQTTTLQKSGYYKFNTNIELTPNFGDKAKVGLKFGASSEMQIQFSHQVSYMEGSDDLGNSEVPFYDQFLYKYNNEFFLRTYSTQYIEFSVAPVQVEF